MSDQVSEPAEGDTGELMYVRCSLCGEWMDVKPGKMNWVSHGLCSRCHMQEMDRIRIFLGERRRNDSASSQPEA
ncbi:MAG: hypothetical protein R6X19_08390 [Kiritimatiellia bacterium]